MENNNKKSKAFIITFVIILIILVGLYFLYQNRETVLGTKGSSVMEKVFSPILGSSKNKNLEVVDNNQTGSGTTTDNPTNTDTSSTTSEGENNKIGNNNSDSDNSNNENQMDTKYLIPGFSSSIGGKFGSGSFGSGSGFGSSGSINGNKNGGDDDNSGRNGSGNINNDNTGLDGTDGNDNLGGDGDEDGTYIEGNACYGQAPLQFEAEEQKKLKEYLQRYYVIKSNLKKTGDIANIKDDISENNSLASRANMLTKICTEQKKNSYTGPTEVRTNPYYINAPSTGYYIKEYKKIEDIFMIW